MVRKETNPCLSEPFTSLDSRFVRLRSCNQALVESDGVAVLINGSSCSSQQATESSPERALQSSCLFSFSCPSSFYPGRSLPRNSSKTQETDKLNASMSLKQTCNGGDMTSRREIDMNSPHNHVD